MRGNRSTSLEVTCEPTGGERARDEADAVGRHHGGGAQRPRVCDPAACAIICAVNAISEYLREQAAAHRATAAENPDDPRYLQSAESLEALADYADAGAEQGIFQMRYLLEHHVVDGRFAWPEGQSGRSIMHFGFDKPVRGEWDLEQFLMDLCDMAKSDAARHIGSNEGEIDRDDAPALAERYGLGVDRVHGALDAGARHPPRLLDRDPRLARGQPRDPRRARGDGRGDRRAGQGGDLRQRRAAHRQERARGRRAPGPRADRRRSSASRSTRSARRPRSSASSSAAQKSQSPPRLLPAAGSMVLVQHAAPTRSQEEPMSRIRKTAAIISTAALLGGGGLGVAQAASGDAGSRPARSGQPGGPMSSASLAKIASTLGVTTAQLKAAMAANRTNPSARPADGARRGDGMATELAAALGVEAAEVQAILTANRPAKPAAGTAAARPPRGARPSNTKLIAALASGLNLDTAKVKAAFAKIEAARKAEHAARHAAMYAAIASDLGVGADAVKAAFEANRPAKPAR